ncbi:MULTISPECIES: tetratricopeptide repeat protein [Streptomonospora]|uniref:Tetratricopeptide repeat protein n=1 Tax=Streptomonospora arabica TaxID=412417 RepID=A0ABV9SK85_9ACTN
MTTSLRDILRKRRSAAFFGRENHRDDYRANLALPPNDEARRFVYNIHGNAGVGKTLLLREFQQLAVDAEFLTARVDDEHADGPLDMLNSVAEQMKSQGLRLEGYTKQYTAYLKTRHELLSSPDVPDNIASMLTYGLTRVGFLGMSVLTGVDVAGHVHPDGAANAIDEGRVWLMSKIKEPQNLRLTLDPIGELTALFLRELAKSAGSRRLAFFFDSFENAAPTSQEWLLALVEGEKHGSLPDDVVITIAGQHKPDPNAWSLLRPFTVDVELHPFTREETSRLLARHGVTDPQTIEPVWELTGGLPVLVDTLAQAAAGDPDSIRDPSGGAVDRFLKGIDDAERRRIARLCALPQYLNQDVLALFVGEEEPERAAELYGWLRSLRFVVDEGGRCHYHQVVRSLMVRLQRNSSPAEFERHHRTLTAYYERVGEPGPPLQQIYHRLCADPETALADALSGAVDACADGVPGARRWTRALEQAAQDSGATETARWAHLLGSALSGAEPEAAFLSHLIDKADLPEPTLHKALRERWRLRHDAGRDAEAFEDIERAIRLRPDDAASYIQRGRTHRELRRLDAAIADFDRACELDSTIPAPLVQRALTFEGRGDHDAALADFTRAFALRPQDGHLLAHRAVLHRAQGRHAESLADFDRALRLTPDDAWTLSQRGSTRWRLDQFEAALADLDRAVELEPTSGRFLDRAVLRQDIGDLEGALADCDRALEADPEYTHVLAHRGDVHRLRGDLETALRDLDRAIAAKPDEFWAIGRRLKVRLLLEDYGGALADFRAAPDSVPAELAGMLLLIADEAMEAFLYLAEKAGRSPDGPEAHPWLLFLTGLAAHRAGEGPRAEEYLRRGIVEGERLRELEPREEAHTFNPAMCHLVLGETDRAVAMVRGMLADSPSPARITEGLSSLRLLRPLVEESACDVVIDLLAEHAEPSDGAPGYR